MECSLKILVRKVLAPDFSSSIRYLSLTRCNLELEKSRNMHRKLRPSLPNLASDDEVTRKTVIKRKIFHRILDFLETYGEKVLSKVLPDKAMEAVRLFSKGTKSLISDMKEFNWVNHVLSQTKNWELACKSLSRRQLEVFFENV